MTDRAWVFGYGSLVAPASIARTLGRPVQRDDGFRAARLLGYSRRWNYGSLRQRGDWHGPHGPVREGIVVSLGIEVDAGAGDVEGRCNGAVVRVGGEELAMLDWRESDYERTDVTDQVTVHGDVNGPVFTYVPRVSAIERYHAARLERRAAVRQSYVDLVRAAFHRLGDRHLDEYVATTPAPDVPVVDFA